MPADEMGERRLPETPAVSARLVLFAVFGFLAFVALTMAGLQLYFDSQVPGRLQGGQRPFPEPTLQISPQGDLDRFRQEQRAALTGFAWVDRSREIVRIPIEDAMRLVASRRERAYDALDQPAVVPQPGSRGGATP